MNCALDNENGLSNHALNDMIKLEKASLLSVSRRIGHMVDDAESEAREQTIAVSPLK